MRTDGLRRPKKRGYPLWISPRTKKEAFELDEVYWFIGKRKGYESGINTYIMTMVSREPRQIVAYAVDNIVSAAKIQEMVDGTVQANRYYTDGGRAYMSVDFIGRHERNMNDKSDTHNIEGSNADLRHYIAGLRRRSRCFFRSIDTLNAVLYVFVHAYNRFGDAKLQYMQIHPDCRRVYHLNHLAFI